MVNSRPAALARSLAPAALLLALLLLALLLALLPLRWALLLSGAGAGLLLLLLEPALGLYLALLSVPLQETVLLPRGLTVTQLVVPLALGAWLLRVLAHPEQRVRWSPIVAAWALLLWALLLSALASPYGASAGLREAARWAVALSVLLLTLNTMTSRWRAVVLVGCLLAAPAANAVVGLVQFVLADGPPSFLVLGGRFARAYGTMGTPNTFAGYMNMAWPLAAALVVSLLHQWRAVVAGSRRQRVATLLALGVLGLLLGLTLAGLLASFSRGAWLGAAAAALVLVALAGRRAALLVAGLLLLLTMITLAGEIDLLPDAVRERVASITATTRVFDVASVRVTPENFAVVERMAHWQAGVRMFLHAPLLGVGAGNFNAAYGDFFVGPWPNSRGHAHNYYIHIAAEAGLLGLTAYLLLLGAVLARLLTVLRHTKDRFWRTLAIGVTGVLVAVVVHNCFENLHVLNMGIQLAAGWGLLVLAPTTRSRRIET